jgi:hypothetical protein
MPFPHYGVSAAAASNTKAHEKYSRVKGDNPKWQQIIGKISIKVNKNNKKI